MLYGVSNQMNTLNNEVLAGKIAIAMDSVVDGVRGSYGAQVSLASLLNQKYEFNWFDVKHTDTSDEGKQVRKDKETLFEKLKAIDHTNPSKIWADVRKYARLERFPDTKVEGEVQDGEQGESGANHNRSPMLRTIEELTALWKFLKRQENLDPKLNGALLHIGKALEECGIRLNMIQ
jgi:hypothetical protein